LQREGDGVGADRKRGDLVAAAVIGRRRTHFFDERGTRDFDGDTRDDGTRGIANGAGDAADLRQRHAWKRKNSCDERQGFQDSTHRNLHPGLRTIVGRRAPATVGLGGRCTTENDESKGAEGRASTAGWRRSRR
jgi:hypothetical protein